LIFNVLVDQYTAVLYGRKPREDTDEKAEMQ